MSSLSWQGNSHSLHCMKRTGRRLCRTGDLHQPSYRSLPSPTSHDCRRDMEMLSQVARSVWGVSRSRGMVRQKTFLLATMSHLLLRRRLCCLLAFALEVQSARLHIENRWKHEGKSFSDHFGGLRKCKLGLRWKMEDRTEGIYQWDIEGGQGQGQDRWGWTVAMRVLAFWRFAIAILTARTTTTLGPLKLRTASKVSVVSRKQLHSKLTRPMVGENELDGCTYDY